MSYFNGATKRLDRGRRNVDIDKSMSAHFVMLKTPHSCFDPHVLYIGQLRNADVKMLVITKPNRQPG